MSHRTARHEKAYRKGKKALIEASAQKQAACDAAADFLHGDYKTMREAAIAYEVDPSAVRRRVQYVFSFLEFPVSDCDFHAHDRPSGSLYLLFSLLPFSSLFIFILNVD